MVTGLLPLWLMSGICIVVFLVYFRYVFCVIPICPSAKYQTPKLVKSVSSKVLFLGLVSIRVDFMLVLAVKSRS